MRIRVFRSGKGDCLLLTSVTGENILVDGGVPDAYDEHWADAAGRMRDRGEGIDLLCISHIDRDHIGGVLRMLNKEMEWRVFDHHMAQPPNERPAQLKKPKGKRPADVRSIWHNAFLEKVRENHVRSGVGTSGFDMSEIMFRNAALLAGGSDEVLPDANGEPVRDRAGKPVRLQDLAEQSQLLAQSVGDAIEVSRRIGAKQLGIALNPEFGGNFVLRKRNSMIVAGMDVHVLGPTRDELNELTDTWNAWLKKNASYLKKLQKKHDRDEDKLRASSPEDILQAARESALAFAGNQTVTPPNLASIVMLVKDRNRSILLTGDADDKSIIDGLSAAKLLDQHGRMAVDVFKVPHHGAHNSYSHALARTVRARHYLFCGDGSHSNPELDVIRDYVRVLFQGRDGHGPALASNQKVKFWFNCSAKLADSAKRKHWTKVEKQLKGFRNQFGSRFSFRLMQSGDSFLLK